MEKKREYYGYGITKNVNQGGYFAFMREGMSYTMLGYGRDWNLPKEEALALAKVYARGRELEEMKN